MKKKPSTLKQLRKDQKEIHKKEVTAVIDETYNSSDSHDRKSNYKLAKSLNWIEILGTIVCSLVFVAIAFLVDVFALPGKYFASTMTTILIVLGLIIWLVLGWVKNRQAANYYNDARRRYLPTMTDDEALIVKIRKLILIFVIIQVVAGGFAFLL
ncbi:hypothetical protein SSABA_v1c07850 [Spiroplasma sabaudiense Ar-1343]|uniref:Transmembrane protein n=1 Tax=Spiroplasma sabaudiense Ar-1343 TaxID=1276257 RepID=W6AAX9_9MOLU|nr:hypothetical protein [Spiroplasma sabaudiense]AHI54187.1 hypothetical protein SSABA_v1c07850 [Spiroplasma sabaudiense Ar-1343]